MSLEDALPDEAIAAMNRWLKEKNAEIEKARLRAYLLTLECRVTEQHLVQGVKTTLVDVVRKLGAEGYVAALKAELLKDGYQESQIENYLAGEQRHAAAILVRSAIGG